MAADGSPDLPRHFADEIVRWQKTHGRHHLPWQNTGDPYRVWLSEIMLQQTQVATVLEYYARFLDRFPSVEDLARAGVDDVLSLWSGLGYYSRARNLHQCAQQVVALHGGRFPGSAEALQSLPGIGPSTAAAIASFCFAERVAILDGNVKRVLTRVLAFKGDLALGGQVRELWKIAQQLLPQQDPEENMPRYTQGLMDLGATICTLRNPGCGRCPVRTSCRGLAGGQPEQYPVKTRTLKRSSLRLSLLWAQKPDGAVWLERRPETGIWGGLYCLPVFENENELKAALPPELHESLEFLRPFKHVLTHKDLHLDAVFAAFSQAQGVPITKIDADGRAVTGGWYAAADWPGLGLPAPIRKLLVDRLA